GSPAGVPRRSDAQSRRLSRPSPLRHCAALETASAPSRRVLRLCSPAATAALRTAQSTLRAAEAAARTTLAAALSRSKPRAGGTTAALREARRAATRAAGTIALLDRHEQPEVVGVAAVVEAERLIRALADDSDDAAHVAA